MSIWKRIKKLEHGDAVQDDNLKATNRWVGATNRWVGEVDSRYLKVADRMDDLRREFSNFRESVTKDIKRLQSETKEALCEHCFCPKGDLRDWLLEGGMATTMHHCCNCGKQKMDKKVHRRI